MFAYVVGIFLAPAETGSAIDCTNGLTPSGDICSTDSTDINVGITGAWTVSVSSSGTLGINITPQGSGVTSTVTDNVNIYTNTPNGYQLYLNSTSGSTDIYNNTDTQQELNHFVATTGTKSSPVTLSSNSWGYSLSSNPTTFSKVETSSSATDSLITTGTKTTGSGDNLPVTYGFKADTKLTPGTYSTQVTYTAIAETPSYTLTSISPNRPTYNATNTEVTILTSTPVSELGLGDITAKIGTINLTNCTEITSGGYRGATCIYPGGLPAGRYNVELTSSWHNATYTLLNAFSINSMQEFTQTNCNNLPESTATIDNRIDLVDSRDGKTYKVSKLADGNCWMVQNLALDGGRTLTPGDSNVTTNRYLANNVVDGDAQEYNSPQIYSGATMTKDGYGSLYGNHYNWNAMTSGTGFESTTGSLSESVCPKNWGLPYGTVSATTEKSYGNLMKLSGLPGYGEGGPNNSAAISKVQQAPLYFPLAGWWRGSYYSGGALGVYGTRTVSLLYSECIIWFQINPGYQNHFGVGRQDLHKNDAGSVRCVFGS